LDAISGGGGLSARNSRKGIRKLGGGRGVQKVEEISTLAGVAGNLVWWCGVWKEMILVLNPTAICGKKGGLKQKKKKKKNNKKKKKK